jgi:hypothetical protein
LIKYQLLCRLILAFQILLAISHNQLHFLLWQSRRLVGDSGVTGGGKRPLGGLVDDFEAAGEFLFSLFLGEPGS